MAHAPIPGVPHPPAPVPPVWGKPIGELIDSSAPEISAIIQAELGITAADVRAFDAPYLATGCASDFTLQRTVHKPIRELADLEPDLHEIHLGTHPDLGELKASIPTWIANDPRDVLMNNPAILSRILPRWFAAACAVGVIPNPAGGPTFTLATKMPLNIVDETLYFISGPSIRGLFFENHFVAGVRFAAATLHAFADLLDPATLDGLDFNMSGISEATPAVIRDWLDKHNIHVTNDTHGQPPVFCGRDSDYYTLRVGANGRVKFHAVAPPYPVQGLEGNTAFNPNTRAMYICGKNAVNTALADYYLWWALQLYRRAMACAGYQSGNSNGVWLVFMACLCGRAALAELAFVANIILHELDHDYDDWGSHDSHCYMGCCHDWMGNLFLHRLSAALGLPASEFAILRATSTSSPKPFRLIDNVDPTVFPPYGSLTAPFSAILPSQKFERTNWSSSYLGSDDCDIMSYLKLGWHCELLKEDHYLLTKTKLACLPPNYLLWPAETASEYNSGAITQDCNGRAATILAGVALPPDFGPD